MGCALLVPLGVSPDGQRVAEIGAFCVDVVFRGTGRGDSLLDYVEQVRAVHKLRMTAVYKQQNATVKSVEAL
jgi:hypothetical protein